MHVIRVNNRHIRRRAGNIDIPCTLVAARSPRQRGRGSRHVGDRHACRDRTRGSLVHRNVVNVHVIVAIVVYGGFAVERYLDGLTCILVQRNGDSFARRADVVIDVVATGIVPYRGIVHAPGGAVVGGDEDDELVIRLGGGTTYRICTVVSGQGQIKRQLRIGQSGDINGRRHQPIFYCSINVKFGMS